jgi:hypothetical protein
MAVAAKPTHSAANNTGGNRAARVPAIFCRLIAQSHLIL